MIGRSCHTEDRQFRTEETMANNSIRSGKTKVIHAGVLLADPDIQPKSEQSILIEDERIKAVSGGFIDPPPDGELIDLRKKFVLPGLIDCQRAPDGAARPRIPIAYGRRFRSQDR